MIAHPLHDDSPAASAGLNGIVDGRGDIDCGTGAGGVGIGGVLDVVIAGGHVDAKADGGIAIVCVLGIEEPGVDAEDGVPKTAGLILDGRILGFARGEEPRCVELDADARSDLIGEINGEEVDAILNFGVSLRADFLIYIADVVLVRELVALAEGELEVAGLEDAALIGGESGLLG